MSVEPSRWSAILAFVYAHPDAPEGIEGWRVDMASWSPPFRYRDDPTAPDTPVEHPARIVPGAVHVAEEDVDWAEGEVRGVPFAFAWSREARRVVIGLSPAHGGPPPQMEVRDAK